MIVIQLQREELENVIHDQVRKAMAENKPLPTQNSIPAPEELLTVEQTAQFLNLKKSTIYTMVSRGELTSLKRSKRIYFLREDLVNYLKAGRRKTQADIQAEAKDYLENNKRGLSNRK